MKLLSTDYLVIGAGAASISFVDTLLTECPGTKVAIIDKHSAPGGHWNDAYDYVHLHQPSLLYGVASTQLEGNWLKLMLTKRILPWNHRASKQEILAHYQSLVDKWVSQGNIQYFPECVYDFSKKPDVESDDNLHTFHSLDGAKTFEINVEHKLINGILGENKVPSQFPPEFPIDDSVQLKTPNQLYESTIAAAKTKTTTNHKKTNKQVQPTAPEQYVVLGAGKTAMDAVVFLQREMKVSPDNIHWVIPNDVWMLCREGPGGPQSWPRALLECDLDVNKAALMLEKEGVFARIDTNIVPTKFRFPVIGSDELSYLRKIRNVIRQGRVTGISKIPASTSSGDAAVATATAASTSVQDALFANNQDRLRVTFQKGDPVEFSSLQNTIFVHCTSPGPFNGNSNVKLFPNHKEINLSLLIAPPVPISMSILAVLEGRRRKGLLDLDFGRKLVTPSLSMEQQGKQPQESANVSLSDHEILNALITGYDLSHHDARSNPIEQVKSLTLIAKFFGLFDTDPIKGYSWMSSNRLSMLSVPGVKCRSVETIQLILEKRNVLNLPEKDIQQLESLREKLAPLEGM